MTEKSDEAEKKLSGPESNPDSSAGAKPEPPKKKRVVLLIDDDDGIRNMLATRLLSRGFSVYEAANGLHAMQKLRSGLEVDFIVSDINMTGLDGFKFIARMREEIPSLKAPIVMISGDTDTQDIKEAKRLGITKVLLKPFKIEELIKALEGNASS